MTEVYYGIGVGRGMVVGPVAKANPAPTIPQRREGDQPDVLDATVAQTASDEVAEALAQVAARFRTRAAAARDGVCGPGAAETLADVLLATADMAADRALLAEAQRRVTAGEPPAEAVDNAVERFVEKFQASGDHLAERVTDLVSVRDHAVALLLGAQEPGVPELVQPSVIVAYDLAPADTAELDPDLVLALVTSHGGPTGHTAIIARQLGIPCVVRARGVMQVADGEEVAVDAAAGTVLVDPDATVRAQAAARSAMQAQFAHDTEPSATLDGHRVPILANIGSPEDARHATEAGAEGVGLFRTEVLFVNRAEPPDAAEQKEVYARVLKRFAAQPVVFRIIDSAADKSMPYFHPSPEQNPALGMRGYRAFRREPGLLHTQLTAIAEAGAETGLGGSADLAVLAPMISTAAEAAEFAAAAREAGIQGLVGSMIEVPAAAIRAEQVLDACDFVSIGTNDLAQYTMATDRARSTLADLLDPFQPAVLDLVWQAAQAGAAKSKPVGVCGESAADPLMALVLVGLGATTLSMSPSAIGAVRYTLRRHLLTTCQAMAAAARAAHSAEDARAAALALMEPEVRTALAL